MQKTSKTQFIKTPLRNIINVSRIVTLLCIDLAPSFRTVGETHDFWELVYVDRGKLNYHAGEELLCLNRGEMVFHRPNEFHNIECDNQHTASVFIINFECHSAAMKLFEGKSFRLPAELAPLMKRLIDESVNNFSSSVYQITPLSDAPLGGQQLIRLYLEELLIKLARSTQESEKRTTEYTSGRTKSNLPEYICEYLEERVYQKVTIAELAAHFHFGKSHLCDTFKAAKGQTIIHYHLNIKVKEAKRMLREENIPIAEISERLGFESPGYFSRIFKKYVGISPRTFRESLISNGTIHLENELNLK